MVRLWTVTVGNMLRRENKEILEDDANKIPSTKKQMLRFLLQVNSVQISHNEKPQKKLTFLCRYCVLVYGDWSTTRWRPALHFGFCLWRLEHNKMAAGTSFHYQLRTGIVTTVESTWPW